LATGHKTPEKTKGVHTSFFVWVRSLPAGNSCWWGNRNRAQCCCGNLSTRRSPCSNMDTGQWWSWLGYWGSSQCKCHANPRRCVRRRS